MSYRFDDRMELVLFSCWWATNRFDDIYQCRMYNGKLLMMERGTARNM
jgi:hypothetical protein